MKNCAYFIWAIGGNHKKEPKMWGHLKLRNLKLGFSVYVYTELKANFAQQCAPPTCNVHGQSDGDS